MLECSTNLNCIFAVSRLLLHQVRIPSLLAIPFMMHFLCVPLPDDYLKELKDQPTQSDENVLADRLNILSQAATGMGDNSTPI